MMNAKRSSKFNLTRYILLVPAVVALLLIFTVSRAALVRKSSFTYKSVATAVNNLAAKITTPSVTAMPAKTPHNKKPKAQNTAAIAGLPIVDTVNKGNTIIGAAEHGDSLTYVINGVKAKKSDFKNLDPDKIYSIEMLNGEQANRLLSEIDGKHNVLFVTTDDSEAGKKFKEKIDELNNHSFTIVGNMGNFKTFRPDSNFMIDSKAKAWTLKGSPRKFRIGALKKAQTLAGANRKWIVTDDGRPFIVDDHHDSILVRGMKDGKVASTMIYGTPGRAFAFAPRALAMSKWKFNNETNISHLSDKLILINGREASARDLKKLSAADIESMSVRSGEEMTKKYGDKAKEGVVFIETKKK